MFFGYGRSPLAVGTLFDGAPLGDYRLAVGVGPRPASDLGCIMTQVMTATRTTAYGCPSRRDPRSIAGQDIGDPFLPITTEMRSDMSSR